MGTLRLRWSEHRPNAPSLVTGMAGSLSSASAWTQMCRVRLVLSPVSGCPIRDRNRPKGRGTTRPPSMSEVEGKVRLCSLSEETQGEKRGVATIRNSIHPVHLPATGESHIPKILIDHGVGGSSQSWDPQYIILAGLHFFLSPPRVTVGQHLFSQSSGRQRGCAHFQTVYQVLGGQTQDFTHLLWSITELWGVCCKCVSPVRR